MYTINYIQRHCKTQNLDVFWTIMCSFFLYIRYNICIFIFSVFLRMITWNENNSIIIDNELILPQNDSTFTDVISALWWSDLGWDVLWYSIDFSLAIVVFVWILVIVWTLKDSIYSSSSLLFQVLSVLLVALWTPLIGLPLYLAIRPLWYKYEREYWKMIMEWYTIENQSWFKNDTNAGTWQVSTTQSTPATKKPTKTTVRAPKKRTITLG